jgi:hypothetical protein
MLVDHCSKSIVDLWMLSMSVHAMKPSLNSEWIVDCLSVFDQDLLMYRNESNKENSPRSSKKSVEENVADDNATHRARAELRVLEQEKSKMEKQRKSHLKDFETSKADARRLLEVSLFFIANFFFYEFIHLESHEKIRHNRTT